METPRTIAPADPIALIRQIEPNHIRHRLRALEAERRALLILLRAARVNRPSGQRGGGDGTR